MRKGLSLILALSMSLALCACGGGGGESAEKVNPEMEDGSIVFDEPVLVHEDDVLRLELTEFYEKEMNWANREPAVEKNVTFKVTNLSDCDFIIDFDLYLGSEQAKYMINDTNGSPEPGKSAYMSFIVQYEDGKDGKALDSLDQLYQLEGTVQINQFRDDTYVDDY